MGRPVIEPRRGLAASATVLAVFFLLLPRDAPCDALSGYPESVREQAARVIAVAGPGREEILEGEIRTLRRIMNGHGILSLNAVPEIAFGKARREGWDGEAAGTVRRLVAVAPLSVPARAWLVKKDLAALRFDDLARDARDLRSAYERFAPARIALCATLSALAAAAAGWFAVWAALALFLKARPALEADAGRVLGRAGVAGPAAVVLLFLLPVAAGFGLAVAACWWTVLAAGYLRRAEIVVAAAVLAASFGVLVGTDASGRAERFARDPARSGWMGVEGVLPSAWPDPARIGGDPVEYARARAAMIAGDPAGAERRLSALLERGSPLPGLLNNRGVSRARQGRLEEARADFDAAVTRSPDDGPALWNAYQARLQGLDLEAAQTIQARAWERLKAAEPFGFRPAEMGPGEWVASPLPPPAIDIAPPAAATPVSRDGGAAYRLFFRPLPGRSAVPFLVLTVAAAFLWRILAWRIWVHATCRGCGATALAAGEDASADLCNACRSQTGAGLKIGEEKELRAQGITRHRRSVRIGSVLVPGLGGVWAGRPIRAALWGFALSAALGGVVATSGVGPASPFVADLAGAGRSVAAIAAVILFAGGVLWGIRAFYRFQVRYNLDGTRG